ncbi:MAG: hypothetical protein QCI00_05535 [Candidatus Thermoplasmatota archaeon]|nr:hypothetical protein [Candidatus Thermoplasmatota archaeon]
MHEYAINIYKKKKSVTTHHLDEIWARVQNVKTGESNDFCIWYKDDEGIIHDETPNLPTKLRGLVDNAWIESCR